MHQKQILEPNAAQVQTAPVQYVNHERIIYEGGKYISQWGNRALISGGKRALQAVEKSLVNSLKKSKIYWEKHIFIGECCDENISFIKSKAESIKANIIIGIGGGKALDAAKAAAEECSIPIICIPTIAATCAATSALSVIYSREGVFKRTFFLTTSPNLVLVDPNVIANAPVIYLEAGILDSLAKWYEGIAVFQGIDNPDIYTSSAICLAEMLNKQMQEKAIRAVNLVKEHRVEETLLHVIDLIVYLTGVIQSMGQKTLRGGIAHAINNGLTIVKESHDLPHGLKVGYGIIVQLVLEKLPKKQVKDTVSFFRKLDFEPSLKGLNLVFNRDVIVRIAEKAANDPYTGKMPFPVKTEMIVSAIEELEENIDKF